MADRISSKISAHFLGSEVQINKDMSDEKPLGIIRAQSGRSYEILECIGRGGFGTVHKAKIYSYEVPKCVQKILMCDISEDPTQSSESNSSDESILLPETAILGDIKLRRFAIKVEETSALLLEIAVLCASQRVEERVHFCDLVDVGIEAKTGIHFMIMTLLGPSLSEMRHALTGRKFSLSTVIRIAMQALHAIQQLHSIGFIQRDVKPSNYAVGLPEEKKHRLIHLLDFGISRFYMDCDMNHLPPRRSPGWRGTSRYCSYNNHLGVDLSRRDDLESWFYAIVEMTSGALPWYSIGFQSKDCVAEMKRLARTLGRREFLSGCPRQYETILQAIDQWGFFTVPDYNGLYVYLMRTMKEIDVSWNDPYDWERTPKLLKAKKVHRAKEVLSNNNADCPVNADQVFVTSVFGHQRLNPTYWGGDQQGH